MRDFKIISRLSVFGPLPAPDRQLRKARTMILEMAHEIGKGLAPLGAELAEHRVQMANPAGVLKSTIVAAILNGDVSMPSASYERSAQVLLRGHVPIYNASPELLGAYTSLSAA